MAFTNLFDEQLNQNIAEAVVEIFYDDDWALEANDDHSKITLIQDDHSKTFSSYAEVLNALEDTIWDHVGNFDFRDFDGSYIFYLTPDELTYLGLEEEMDKRLAEPSRLIDPKELDDHEEALDTDLPKEEPKRTDSSKQENPITKKEEKEIESQTNQKGKKQIPYRELAKLIDQNYPILDVVKEAGLHLERNSSNTYTTKEHDSLIIHPDRNRFYWNSRGEMNGSVRLYQLLMGKDFRETVETLSQRMGKLPAVEQPKNVTQKKKDIHHYDGAVEAHRKLWTQMQRTGCQNTSLRETFAYLTKTRQIDPEIVQTFIDRGLLYQGKDQKGHPVAVFVGRNEFGLINSACFRSTFSSSKFKGDFSGCDYERGWFFEPTKDLSLNPKATPATCKELFNTQKMLLVFESQIEMMSYMTILKENKLNWRNFAYLSCGSINKNQCVDQTCALYGYKEVVMMFNNDIGKDRNPGKEMAEQVQKRLQDQGLKADVHLPRDANDWNDSLCKRHEQNEKQVSRQARTADRER